MDYRDINNIRTVKSPRSVDWEYVWASFVPRVIILLAAGCIIALMTACGGTVAPAPVISHTPSVDIHGKATSGILEFHSDYIVVDQHWIDRYYGMVAINRQKPDLVNGKTNPDKVFIVGKEDLGIVQMPDGNYKASYITLMYFDRLNEKLKANRRI